MDTTSVAYVLCRIEDDSSFTPVSQHEDILTGIAFDTISRLETGKQRAQPRTIRKLADALGAEPRELMKGVGGG